MSAPNRELGSFARAVEALSPYLDELVFVGGWAHYLYTVLPEAAPLGFEPLRTEDADIAAPLGVRARAESIPALLSAAGFELQLSGDHVPPISEFVLRDDPSGFYLEFIAPLVGGEVKRGGRVASTVNVGGTTAQLLRYVDLLLALPWKVRLTIELGFPVRKPTTIQIANPASYVVQKVLALQNRHPSKQPKDVLYLHDTFAAFADAMPRVRAAWDALRPTMIPAHVRTFRARAKGLAWEANDLARSAARIAADRPRPPSFTALQAVLQRGFREGFDVTR